MDPYSVLLNHIQKEVSLDEESKGYIREEFTMKELRKKEILLQQGDVSQYIRCTGAAHIHQDATKIEKYESLFGRDNERFFTDPTLAEEWILQL